MTITEIEKETGRRVIEAELPCGLCGSCGFSQFGECEACEGRGRYKELIYADCCHEVALDECEAEGCLCCDSLECDNKKAPFDSRCTECRAVADYYAAQYAHTPKPMTEAEINDCYSEPAESHKRASMLRRMDNQ